MIKKLLGLLLLVSTVSWAMEQEPTVSQSGPVAIGQGLTLSFNNWPQPNDARLVPYHATQSGLWIINNSDVQIDIVEKFFTPVDVPSVNLTVPSNGGKTFVGSLKNITRASNFSIEIHGQIIGVAQHFLGGKKGQFSLSSFSPYKGEFRNPYFPQDESLVITIDSYDRATGFTGSAEWQSITASQAAQPEVLFGLLRQKLTEAIKADEKTIDPRHVLDLPVDYTSEQLSDAYKRKSGVLTTPESKTAAQLVGKAYRILKDQTGQAITADEVKEAFAIKKVALPSRFILDNEIPLEQRKQAARDLLQISSDASPQDIQEAYNRLTAIEEGAISRISQLGLASPHLQDKELETMAAMSVYRIHLLEKALELLTQEQTSRN